jgi:hypothetical protein
MALVDVCELRMKCELRIDGQRIRAAAKAPQAEKAVPFPGAVRPSFKKGMTTETMAKLSEDFLAPEGGSGDHQGNGNYGPPPDSIASARRWKSAAVYLKTGRSLGGDGAANMLSNRACESG